LEVGAERRLKNTTTTYFTRGPKVGAIAKVSHPNPKASPACVHYLDTIMLSLTVSLIFNPILKHKVDQPRSLFQTCWCSSQCADSNDNKWKFLP